MMRIRLCHIQVAALTLAFAAAVLRPAVAQQLQSTVPNSGVEAVRQALAPLVVQRRANVPEVFKGIYLSFWSASLPSRVDNVIQLAQDGLINTVVIDVKGAMGRVAFDSKVPQAVEYRSRERIIPDLGALVRKLHAAGLHVVARMVTFNDPMLARARPDLAVQPRGGASRRGSG